MRLQEHLRSCYTITSFDSWRLAMRLHGVWQLVCDFRPKKPVCVEPVDENLSTDAGLLVFRQWDEPQEVTKDFVEQLDDQRRDPDHTTLEMVRSRLFGILAATKNRTIMIPCARMPSLSCWPIACPRMTTSPASPRCRGSRTPLLRGPCCGWKIGSSNALSILSTSRDTK